MNVKNLIQEVGIVNQDTEEKLFELISNMPSELKAYLNVNTLRAVSLMNLKKNYSILELNPDNILNTYISQFFGLKVFVKCLEPVQSKNFREQLDKYRLTGVIVSSGKSETGLTDFSPYDNIINYSVDVDSAKLLLQLDEGGKLITYENINQITKLVLYSKSDNNLNKIELESIYV